MCALRFNAFAIHGNIWGESKPAESDKSYEALYPVDTVATGIKEPDFHYLQAFQKIDLSEIGYKAPTDLSPIWKKAIDHGNLKFEYVVYLNFSITGHSQKQTFAKKTFASRYLINQTSDCQKPIESSDYVARIVTEKLVSQRKASFHVHVEDAAHVRHVIPSDLVVEGKRDPVLGFLWQT
jgi:hypothetical protein